MNGEPFLKLVACETADSGRQTAAGFLIGEILNDRRAFRQRGAVVEPKHRHVAFGIDRVEILTALGLMGLEIDLFDFERNAGLHGDDVRRQRAGARAVIQFHVKPLGSCVP
jgi:hypothetical protein